MAILFAVLIGMLSAPGIGNSRHDMRAFQDIAAPETLVIGHAIGKGHAHHRHGEVDRESGA